MALSVWKKSTARSRLLQFCKEEHGTASVDGVIWILFFMLLVVFILDAAIMFQNNTQVRRITQDGSRVYIRDGFSDGSPNPEQALDTWIEAKLEPLSPDAEATTTYDEDTDIVTTEVVYPASDTDISGFFDVLTGFNIQVVVINQKMEF